MVKSKGRNVEARRPAIVAPVLSESSARTKAARSTMAMMDSAGWDHQDHQGLQPSAEDDFQQFLNIGNIGSLADGLHFEFQDFPNAGHGTLMSQGSREQLDTPMGGTEAAVVLGDWKSTRLNSSHRPLSRMPSSA